MSVKYIPDSSIEPLGNNKKIPEKEISSIAQHNQWGKTQGFREAPVRFEMDQWM